MTTPILVRRRVRVSGVVQGVGFRPFVHRLACELRLAGHVGNDADGVFIEIEGAAPDVACFERRLVDSAPPLARIATVQADPVHPLGERDFRIADSVAGGPARTFVSPDVAVCDQCLAEMDRPRGSEVPVPLHQLHQLRAAVHDHPPPALRPAEHHHGRLRHVPGVL